MYVHMQLKVQTFSYAEVRGSAFDTCSDKL